MKDNTQDLVVLFHNSTQKNSQKSLKRFEMAVKYVLKLSKKKPRIRFGTLDCSLNDCFYYLKITSDLPMVAYFKPWEHGFPAFINEHYADHKGAL